MLVEELKMLVADLFKQSEDAVPVFGDGDKKEWMAYHLDRIIEEDGEALQCLLGFNLISDVTDFLESEYKERKDEDRDPALPCDNFVAENQIDTSDTAYSQLSNNQANMRENAIADEPVLVIEEEVVIMNDRDCGC